MKAYALSMIAAIAAIGIGGIAAPAVAADLGDNPGGYVLDTKSVPFQGLSIGADAGGAFQAWSIDTNYFDFDGISSDGLTAGINAEYLFAVGSLRIGPYAEGGFANVNTDLSINFGGPTFTAEMKQNCYYGGGLKLGVIVARETLVYGRAGYERQCWQLDTTFGGSDADVDAWILGGGIETMIAEHWSLGLDGSYAMLSHINFDKADGKTNDLIDDVLGDSEQLRVKARLNYRF